MKLLSGRPPAVLFALPGSERLWLSHATYDRHSGAQGTEVGALGLLAAGSPPARRRKMTPLTSLLLTPALSSRHFPPVSLRVPAGHDNTVLPPGSSVVCWRNARNAETVLLY